MTILANRVGVSQRQMGVLAAVTGSTLASQGVLGNSTMLPLRPLPEPGGTGCIKPPGHIGEYLHLELGDTSILRPVIEAYLAIPKSERPTLVGHLLKTLPGYRPTWHLDEHIVVELIRWAVHVGIFSEWPEIAHELPEYRVVYRGSFSPLVWLRPRRPEAILPGEWDENLDGDHSYGYLGEARGFRGAVVQVKDEKVREQTFLDLDGVLPDGVAVYVRLPLSLKALQAKKGRKRGRYVMVDSRHFPKWLLAELKPLMHIPDRKCRDRRVYLHRVLAALWLGKNLNPFGKFKPLQVHHLNELVKDNRIWNLLPLTEAEHALFHDDYRPGMVSYNDLGVVGTAEEDWAEDSAEGWSEDLDWGELYQLLEEVRAAA